MAMAMNGTGDGVRKTSRLIHGREVVEVRGSRFEVAGRKG